jgi:ATP-dependent RNA helicase RhlE
MTFKELEIVEPIMRALKHVGYTHPTPIQEQSIPILLQGKDLLGCAQTGTGKTAAFAIPILQHLFLDKQKSNDNNRRIKALVVAPTRELAIQIGDSFTEYGRFTGIRNTVIFGGVKQGAQTTALSRGVDILVATPGRLLDLMGQGFISLSNVQFSVLDEADRMLDMGFIHDIRKIIDKLPENRQSLFFSATMPPDIVKLSRQMIKGNPEKVTVKPEQVTAELVQQSVYYVSKQDKPRLLVHLLNTMTIESALVFSRTKHGANKIVKKLNQAGINADAIHGNKSQGARQRALGAFKNGDTRVLVATDIAARGIDVDKLSHVINFDLPNISETYVHRIGRTGRARESGIALSFCSMDERPFLRDIQKLIGQQVPLVAVHPFIEDGVEKEQPKKAKKPQRAKPWQQKAYGKGRSGNKQQNRGSSQSRKRG